MGFDMYHYQECGLNNIWLVNGYDTVDIEGYGDCTAINDVKGLDRAIACDLVYNKPLLTGAEFRFLRKNLELSQKALSDLIGKDEQAIARWEKAVRVPKQADRMLRAFVMDFYQEQTGLIALIKRLRDIDEQAYNERHFRDDQNTWKVAA